MNKQRLMLHKEISYKQFRKLSFDFGYINTKILIKKPAQFKLQSLTRSTPPIDYLVPSKQLQVNPSSVTMVTFSIIMSKKERLVNKSQLQSKKNKLNVKSHSSKASDVQSQNKENLDNEGIECINVDDCDKNQLEVKEIIQLNEEIEQCHLDEIKVNTSVIDIKDKNDENENKDDDAIEVYSVEDNINDNKNMIMIDLGNDIGGGNAHDYNTEVKNIIINDIDNDNNNEYVDDNDEDDESITDINDNPINNQFIALSNNSNKVIDITDTHCNRIEVIDVFSSSKSNFTPIRDKDKEVSLNKSNPNHFIPHSNNKESIFIEESQEEDIDECLSSQFSSTEQMFTYTYQITNTINLSWRDYYSLNPEKYVNDIIINFYLRFIEENFNRKSTDKVLIMNSYYYSLISKDDKGQMNNLLKSFFFKKKYSRVDIFANDYVIIPIYEHLHWSLAIIVSPYKIANLNRNVNASSPHHVDDYPMIIYLDSYFDNNNKCIKILKKLLCSEYIRTFNTESVSEILGLQAKCNMIQSVTPKMPKQPNAYDCGIFLLAYSEIFIYNPTFLIEKIKLNMLDLENSFDERYTNTKRKEMQRLIKKVRKNDREGIQRYLVRLERRIKKIISQG